MQLKCIKCGAPISEEQLLCSACGFQNDLELSKKLVEQEKEAERLKEEQQKAEKVLKEKEKLTNQKSALDAQMKKTGALAVCIKLLFGAIVAFAVIGCLGTIIELRNKANTIYGASSKDIFWKSYIIASFNNAWNTQGLKWLTLFGLVLSSAWTPLVNLLKTTAAIKKAKEIGFMGKEWLKEKLEENKTLGITNEKFLYKKTINDRFITFAVVDIMHPELNVKRNLVLKSVLSTIIGFLGGIVYSFLIYHILLLVSVGGPVATGFIVSIVLTVVVIIVDIATNLALERPVMKALTKTLNEISNEN